MSAPTSRHTLCLHHRFQNSITCAYSLFDTEIQIHVTESDVSVTHRGLPRDKATSNQAPRTECRSYHTADCACFFFFSLWFRKTDNGNGFLPSSCPSVPAERLTGASLLLHISLSMQHHSVDA